MQTRLSLDEFERRFSTDKECRQHLEKVRWPNGFVCPGCGSANGKWLQDRKVTKCCNCGKQTSSTAGTLFHGAKRLHAWYFIISHMHADSAHKLAKKLSMSYSSVWEILRKIRSRIVLAFPVDAQEVDLEEFESVLFRRSCETPAFTHPAKSSENEPSDGDIQRVSRDADTRSAIAAMTFFIRHLYQGVSRRHAITYAAAFWLCQDRARWSFRELLNLFIRGKPSRATISEGDLSSAVLKIPLTFKGALLLANDAVQI
jgi:hypothetical protein